MVRALPVFVLSSLLLACGGAPAPPVPSDVDPAPEGPSRPAPQPPRPTTTPAAVPDAATPAAAPDAAPPDTATERAPSAPDARAGAAADAQLDAQLPSPDAEPLRTDTAAPAPPPPDVVPVLLIQVGNALSRTPVPGTLKVIQDHDGTLNGITARPAVLETALTIRTRGNSSSRFPKKSYAIELADAQGNERSVSLLGMPPESDWVLYACYSDKTCLRNALTYSLARELGRWSPDFRYVEVFLDGQYVGLYNLVEKVKRDKNRIALPAVAEDASKGDVTGGYIIKRDGPGDGPNTFWDSRDGNRYTYHYPKDDRITDAQKTYIRGHLDAFEAAMRGADFADATRGYRKWIDVPSFVDYLLMSELTKNLDAYRRSAYVLKAPDAQGGRLSMGPPWDYDLAYGNAYRDTTFADELWTKPERFVHEIMSQSKAPENVPSYWQRLVGDTAFRRDLKCRWTALRKGPLSNARITATIDAHLKLTAAAERRDHMKWPTIGVYVWPNFFVGKTYAEEVTWLRRWIEARLRWMDANVPGTCPT